ncbi:MAG: PDZ domain-containing protein [Pseudomonadota bacterium]
MNRSGPAAALALLLTGCQATLPAATDAPPEARLEQIVSADAMLARIGHRLSVANVELCPRTALLAGWSLHAASLYGAEVRAAAAARLGVEGDLPGVAYVVPGGPAEVAGMRAGDLILAVEGRDLSPGPARDEPDAEGFFANRALIDAALAGGAARLRVRRGADVLDLVVTPERGCGYAFLVDPSPELYASAYEDQIQVSTGLTAYAGNEDDLAVWVSHEFAHAVLQHPSERRGLGHLPWRTEAREREADRVGLYLMARAGYDPARAPVFWRRASADFWQIRAIQWGHPSGESRASALEPVVTDIARLRASGSPIRP